MNQSSAGATKTTVTETECTHADGRVEKSRVVVTEVAATRAAPTTVAEVAQETVGDVIDVVERGVAVVDKVRTMAKLAGTLFGQKE